MDHADLISNEWRQLNRRFHRTRADWGANGAKWARGLTQLAVNISARDILDYGSGKGTLANAMPRPVRCYEPAFDDPSPEPADLVVCTHVLEHVEPEWLDRTLRELQRLTRVALFVSVGSGPSRKIMPDGRDSNLIQRDPVWWEHLLRGYFPEILHVDRHAFQRGKIQTSVKAEKTLTVVALPAEPTAAPCPRP